MPNASIGIGQYDLSQQVSPPIVYKIGPFFKKKRVYCHTYMKQIVRISFYFATDPSYKPEAPNRP